MIATRQEEIELIQNLIFVFSGQEFARRNVWMAVNVFKRTNAIAQKATMDYTVNFVSAKCASICAAQWPHELFLLSIAARCVIPCMNGGKCIGNNKCRCPDGLGGNHCEIVSQQRMACKKPCRHGMCMPNHQCECHEGWFGRYCNQREDKRNRNRAPRIWWCAYAEQGREDTQQNFEIFFVIFPFVWTQNW